MSEPTIKQLQEKLNELISKHNDLAAAVQDLCQAVELITDTVMGTKDKPEKLDS